MKKGSKQSCGNEGPGRNRPPLFRIVFPRRSGFTVHNPVRVAAGDAGYLLFLGAMGVMRFQRLGSAQHQALSNRNRPGPTAAKHSSPPMIETFLKKCAFWLKA